MNVLSSMELMRSPWKKAVEKRAVGSWTKPRAHQCLDQVEEERPPVELRAGTGGEGVISEEWMPQKPEEYGVSGKREWQILSNGAVGSRKTRIENAPLTRVTWKPW